MGVKKNQHGFVLIYVLGAIVLISFLVGGIFFFARLTFGQIEKIDQVRTLKEVEEYALQDAKAFIKNRIEYTLKNELATRGTYDESTIGSIIENTLTAPPNLSSAEYLGTQGQFAFEVTIASKRFEREKIASYALESSGGKYGWEKQSQTSLQATNYRYKIPLAIEITEKKENLVVKTHQYQATYFQEIQWNEFDVRSELLELDVWRNLQYAHYLPNGGGYLSADAWMRKLKEIEGYAPVETFNYNQFDNREDHSDGGFETLSLFDIADGRHLNFSNSGKPLLNELNFGASLHLNYGVEMVGRGSRTEELQVLNALMLKNQKAPDQRVNYLQKLDVRAATGTYVEITGDKSKLIFDGQDTRLRTSGMLIHNTQSMTEKNNTTEGFLLASGELIIKTIGSKQNDSSSSTNSFDFKFYRNVLGQKSSQEVNTWREFAKGSMIIASSNFYGGAVSEGRIIHSERGDQRKITVAGNFMLTNANFSETEAITYFKKNTSNLEPNQASTLTLDGENTKMTVAGVSFIDSPKVTRRPSPNETGSKEDYVFYNDEDYWNSIVLKNSASLELNYTGTEPFKFQIEKDAMFKLKLFPNLEFFDSSFLNYAVNRGQLKGKVLIEVASQGDAEKLQKKLNRDKIPNTVATDSLTAKNGEVTIVQPLVVTGLNSTKAITRVFGYLE